MIFSNYAQKDLIFILVIFIRFTPSPSFSGKPTSIFLSLESKMFLPLIEELIEKAKGKKISQYSSIACFG